MSAASSPSPRSARRLGWLLAATLVASLVTPLATSAPARAAGPQVVLSGTVTGPAGPVAGARVEITQPDGHPVTTVTADGTGAYRAALSPGTYRAGALPPADNLVRLADGAQVDVEATADRTVALALRAPSNVGTVRREVTGSAPVTVQGARISVTGYDGHGEIASAVSASDGSWAVHVPGGTYALRAQPPAGSSELLVPHDGYLFAPAAGPDVLLRLPNVTGLVRDPDARPVAGAAVEAFRPGRSQAWAVAVTDAQGRFGLRLDEVQHVVTARPPDGSPAGLAAGQSTVTVPARDVVVELVRANLLGRVLSPDGSAGQAGARVEVLDGHDEVVDAAVADSTGAYGLRLPAGPARLTAYGADAPYDWLPGSLGVTVAADGSTAGNDVRLQLADVVGTVTAGGGPASGVRVRLLNAAGDPVGESVRTDAQGRFALLAPAGRHGLAFSAPYPYTAPDPLTFTRPAGQRVTGLTAVLLSPTLTGRVLGPDGAGRSSALTVVDLDRREQVALPPGRDTSTFGGDFALLLPAGTYRVTAVPGGCGSSPCDSGERLSAAAATVTVPADGAADVTLAAGRRADQPWVAERLTVSPSGTPANADSDGAALSGDGRHAAFSSAATNLVTTAAGGRQVYVRDLLARTTELVSRSSSGAPAGTTSGGGPAAGPSASPSSPATPSSRSDQVALDADASVVAFRSTASDLVAADTNGQPDVFVRDRAAGTTVRVSQPQAGGQADAESGAPSLDGTGRRVAFVSRASTLVPGVAVPAGGWQVYLLDRDTGALTAPLSGTSDSAVTPVLSADGSTLVAHAHRPDDPVTGARDGWTLVAVALATGTVTDIDRVSDRNSSGETDLRAPSVSPDGTRLGYTARLDQEGRLHGVLQPRTASRTGPTWTVARPPLFTDAPVPGPASLAPALLSADGSSLAVEGPDPLGQAVGRQVWLAPAAGGPTRLTTLGPVGLGADNWTFLRAVSPDARALLVEGGAGDLVAGTTEPGDDSDVYLVRRADDTAGPTWAEPASALTASDVGPTVARLSWQPATDPSGVDRYRLLRDGQQVLDTTGTTHLVTGLAPDTSYAFQVQARDGAGTWSADGPTLTLRTAGAGAGPRLLDATAGTGGRVELVWEAAPVQAALRLYRREGAGTFAPVADLPAGTSTHTDTGLAAGTTYAWQVRRISGGTEVVHTGEATATTPALSITGTDVIPTLASAGSATGRLVRSGSDLGLVVRGEPGRAASAVLSWLSWLDEAGARRSSPVPAATTVTLTETTDPGTYQGAFPLAAGVAEVTGVLGRLSDGHGSVVTAAASRVPLRVAGRLTVSFPDSPAGSLVGATLVVSSASAGSALLPTDGEAVAADLVPGDDYRLTLSDAQARRVGGQSGLAVRPGLPVTVGLSPTLPADLTVDITDPESGALPYASVVVTDADGEYVGWGSADHTGRARVYGALSHGPVTVTVTPPYGDELLQPRSVPLVLTPGANTVVLASGSRPSGTIRGVVQDQHGAPLPEALVTLSQTGTPGLERRTTTDADGRYTLRGAAGAGILRASAPGVATTRPVTVVAGSIAGGDLVLRLPSAYRVRLDVFTRSLTSAYTGPLPMDVRTASSLALVLTGPDGTRSGYSLDSAGSDPGTVLVRGYPGDVVQLCGNGRALGDPGQRCSTVTLGEATDVVAELRLGAAARLVVPVRAADGSPFPGSWEADLARRLPDGTYETSGTLRGSGTDAEVPVPEAGTWRVTLRGNGGTGSTEQVLATGADLRTPTVRLRRPAHLSAASDAVTAIRNTVRPGGLLDLRAQITNAGAALPAAALRLSVPAGATAVADQVLLDGLPATGVTASAGQLEVPLGPVAAGATRVVRYQLRIDAGNAAAAFSLGGELVHGGEAESLAPAEVTADRLTLAAPASVSGSELTVSGTALPHASVRVYDGARLLTTTAATRGGVYRTAVTLPARPLLGRHALRAETDSPDGTLTSPTVPVRVEPQAAVATRLRIAQAESGRPQGRAYSWDPRQGVARFPFVIIPWQPLEVTVTFDRPELVRDVDVHVGEKRVRAVAQPDGSWRAEHTYPQGEISATWTSVAQPTPVGSADRPAEADLRPELPPLFEGFRLLAAPPSAPGPDGSAGTSVRLALPAAQGGATATVRTTYSDPGGYTVTAEDRAAEARTGVAMYGLALDEVPGQGPVRTIRLTGYVPRNQVVAGAGPGRSASGMRTGSRGLRALAAGDTLVKVTMDMAMELTERNAFDAGMDAANLAQSTGNQDKYGRIMALRSALRCPEKVPGTVQYLDETLPTLAMRTDLVVAGGGLLAALAAPATFGVGTVALGLGTLALGKALDDNMNARLAGAEWLVRHANTTLCDPPSDPGDPGDWDGDGVPDGPEGGSSTEGGWGDSDGTGPAGSPVWIYDPSGYVYEGVAAQRLEGVQATLLHGATRHGPWRPWDAGWYGQVNPLVTDAAGKYAWDVPEGWWKVQFDKPGYETAFSDALPVLPPQLDVNVAMVPVAPPSLAAVRVVGGELEAAFTQWMDPASVATELTVTDAAGNPVAGTVAPSGGQPVPGTTRTAAQRFRFAPAAALAPGG
ncbi:MAG: hypothetical protein JWN57_415, partial [Frankiales bacterium]|nr:hypothetical protein [Frankiales bacterium]